MTRRTRGAKVRRRIFGGRRRGKAHRLAAARNTKYGDRQIFWPRDRKPSWLDDWRFIWANRTHHGKRRSWIQRLFRW